MLKIVAAGATALFITASPLAYAQTPSGAAPERLSIAAWNTLTDLRIDLVKAALQLTPEQAKYWPPIESAIRARAQNRQARLAFLKRRADALAQRSADLKKLADAWQPLYQTLSPEQKQRMGALTLFVLHDMSDAVEQRRAQSEDED